MKSGVSKIQMTMYARKNGRPAILGSTRLAKGVAIVNADAGMHASRI
jgi:hypothetical protein